MNAVSTDDTYHVDAMRLPKPQVSLVEVQNFRHCLTSFTGWTDTLASKLKLYNRAKEPNTIVQFYHFTKRTVAAVEAGFSHCLEFPRLTDAWHQNMVALASSASKKLAKEISFRLLAMRTLQLKLITPLYSRGIDDLMWLLFIIVQYFISRFKFRSVDPRFFGVSTVLYHLVSGFASFYVACHCCSCWSKDRHKAAGVV